MVEMADRHPRAGGTRMRALNQMARELLLAQSSDWAFILKTGTHTSYAYQRMQTHLARFTKLYDAVAADRVDEPWLAQVESTDALFPAIDYRLYATTTSS